MAENPLTLEIPYPPSVNSAWRTWRGRTILSKAVREFRQEVGARWLCYRNLNNAKGFGKSPVACNITVCPPDNRKRDLDNILKALFDALQHARIIEDDSQIRRLEVAFGRCPQPGLMVVLRRLPRW